MSSYLLIPAKFERINEEEIIENIKKNCVPLGAKNGDEFRCGTLPTSILSSDNCIYFEYGFEKERYFEVLKDNNTIKKKFKVFNKFRIIILRNHLIAISKFKSNKDRDKVINFLEKKIIRGYLLDEIRFNERFLRKLPEKYEMHQFDFEPVTGNNYSIEIISVKGRTDIKHSEFAEKYFDEPLKSIKIAIEGENRKETEITFYRSGSIRIFQKLEPVQILEVMKFIVDKVIYPEIPNLEQKDSILNWLYRSQNSK